MRKERHIIESLLVGSGITINGRNAYDPQVHKDDFYSCVLREGSLGLGEAYIDGWWNCEALDEFFNKLLRSGIDQRIKKNWHLLAKLAWNSFGNMGKRSKAFEIGERHYNVGNDLYRSMLDTRLTYTCGYWNDVKNLNGAQEAKS